MLFKNLPYINLTLAISVLFFVISGVQYWVTFYLIEVLSVPEKKANIYFGATAITSPVLGAAMSGFVATRFDGGYGSPKLLPFCNGLGLIGVFSAFMVPYVDNYVAAIGFVWILLFIGALILPIATGVMLGKVEPEMRPKANALSNLSYNLLGYFPAPILYGLANSVEGTKKSRWGMCILMYITVFMELFIFLATFTDKKVTWKMVFSSKSKSEKVSDNYQSISDKNSDAQRFAGDSKDGDNFDNLDNSQII